jgi:HD-GYP domain-containing protein (c-di-GMP phosphodiesterase class II)
MPGLDVEKRGLSLLGSALEVRDEHTHGHCTRTEALAVELGRQCRLQDTWLRTLRMAARAHDIGKIGVPDHVLFKQGRLDPDEWLTMQAHSRLGCELIIRIAAADSRRVAHVVLHHHEAFDGSGYPDGRAGEAIPTLSRIIAIVDAYDAIAERRSYHAPRCHAEVMDILNGENAHKYDPFLLSSFNRLIETSGFRAAGDVA